MQPQGDVGGGLAPGHEAGGLAFGEHGAHAADLDALVRAQGKAPELFQGQVQGQGHEFQELAGPRGAAVVHFEADHPAGRVEGNDLGVLAADVQHGPGLRGQKPGPPRIGLDLGDGRDLPVLQMLQGQFAAIARGYQRFRPHVLQEPAALGQGVEGGGHLGPVHQPVPGLL